jgi:hypothetical protein
MFLFHGKKPVIFYRKVHKGYAKGAKPLRSLRKLCVPCGKYFILILKVYKLFISHH